MIDRLFDRVPEAWAERWARRLNIAHVLFMVAYLIAWWGMGLKVLATRHLSVGAAIFASMAWVPVMILWLIVHGLYIHHQIRRGRQALDSITDLQSKAMEHARKVHREVDEYRRRELDLPEDAGPALH